MKKIFTLAAGIALTASISASADPVKLYPCTFEGDNLADAQETQITRDEDGNIIINDFFYSDAPVSFKFEIPEPNKYSDITFTGYLDRNASYPYLMDAEGYYPSCWLWNYEKVEDWTEIRWPYVCEEGYSYVYRYDLTDPENEGYKEYYGLICMSGTAADGNYFPWVYVNFYFDIPEVTSVSAIDSATDARVEYFNLAGQRVENPSNGIFIRKQGGKAAKVIK